jgi:excisionase family DNA binding protein
VAGNRDCFDKELAGGSGSGIRPGARTAVASPADGRLQRVLEAGASICCVYTPEMLAREWGCSARHVRNLVKSGELRAFRPGPKLIRIRAEWVEEYECRRSTKFNDCAENSPSSTSTPPENGTGTRLEPQTRLRLRTLRQQSS